ncbi:MAG: hypothetical protein HQ510_08330 [Candidatus Marinimicrobia bacterium]|nr:hypothetical protein [Candidatus Neomarinimicrobiota bacterium]
MNNKILQAIKGGIIATLVMTMVMFVAPYIGLPKMNPAAMLSMMMGVPLFVGWILHFMIGTIFAFSYVILVNPALKKVTNKLAKGVIFGVFAFIMAQIAMPIMGAMFGGMSAPAGNMTLMMIGSIIGHIVFGIVVVFTVKLHD